MLSIRVSHSLAIAARTIIANRIAAARLTPLSIEVAVLGLIALMDIPIATGRVVSKNMVIPRPMMSMVGADSPMKWLIEKPTTNGNVITDTTETTAVYEIESAVSPLANFVSMFDVTPPGQHARIIRPTASSLSRSAKLAMAKPTIGSTSI